MAENIVHLVLARTPDAAAGVKGISVFIVPKFLVREDGSLGERNDVKCLSIEKSWVSKPLLPRFCNMARRAARLAIWLARKIKGWRLCLA